MLIRLIENKDQLAKYGEWATSLGFFFLAFSAWLEQDLSKTVSMTGWGLICAAVAYSGILRVWPRRISQTIFRRYFIRS